MLHLKQRLFPHRKTKTAVLFTFFVSLHILLLVTVKPRPQAFGTALKYSSPVTLHIKGDISRVAQKPPEKEHVEKKPVETPVKEAVEEEEKVLEEEPPQTEQEQADTADTENSQGGNSSEAEDASGLEDIRTKIIELIERNKIYPLAARKRELEGDVTVSFVVQTDGSVSDIITEGKNVNTLLKQAAAKSVSAAFPCPLPVPTAFEMTVTLRYSLYE